MSLATLTDPGAGPHPVVTLDRLRETARKTGFTIAPADEAGYLLGLQSTYDITQEVQALPDYIDPRLEPVPTRSAIDGSDGSQDGNASSRSGIRAFQRPLPANNVLSAWCHVFALEAAAPETALLRGRAVVVKDTIAVGHIPQTLGTLPQFLTSPAAAGQGYPRSPIDATVVRRLLLAGATLRGTTTCEHFSLSPMSFSSALGPVHNPWQRGFNSGGSSSGSAALLGLHVRRTAAAKQGTPLTDDDDDDNGPDITLALGGDQAGSIRIPAAFCGVCGLKPTFGLVPYTGIAGLLPMTDYAGPMATTVDDLALLLSAIAGDDGLDPRMGPETPRRDAVPAYHELLAQFAEQVQRSPSSTAAGAVVAERPRLRIGLLSEGFAADGVAPEVAATVRAAAEACWGRWGGETGIDVALVDVSVPLHAMGARIWTAAVRGQMASHAFGGRAPSSVLAHDLPHIQPPAWPPGQAFCDELTRANPAVVLSALGETLVRDALPLGAQRKAHRHVLQLRAAYDAALERCDVLAMPTTPTVAPPLPEVLGGDASAHSTVEPLLRLTAGVIHNTAPFNATGHPAVTVPCGWAPAAAPHEGVLLPVGLQIVGRRFDDLGVLKAARLFELGGGQLGPRPAA